MCLFAVWVVCLRVCVILVSTFSFDVVLLLWRSAVVLWTVCYLVGFC